MNLGKQVQMANERLGCLSDLQVFVTDQCEAPRLCQLTNITNLQWNRKLDDISEASVEVAISDPECCECLASLEPWCHMLHIIRNGDLVWQGPITRITYGFNSVKVEAKDILAFLQVTVPEAVLDTRILHPAGQEITDLARTVLGVGFDGRNQCFLKNIVQTDLGNDSITGKPIRPTLFSDTTISPDNGFHAFDGTVFDWFQILAQNGLDYTVIGLTIVLSVENANIQTLGVLTDEDILGEIAITKDGLQMSNRVIVRYQGDDSADPVTSTNGVVLPGCQAQCAANNHVGTCAACAVNGFVQPCYVVPCPAITIGDESCYGPIDRVINNGAAGNYTTAKQTADAYVKVGSIAPRIMEFPGGTKLSPDTPWGINDMVPGQQINTAFTQVCVGGFQSFRLLEVDYQLSSGGDEEISLSMGQLNLIGSTI